MRKTSYGTEYKTPLCCCVVCGKEYSMKGIHSHYRVTHTEDGRLCLQTASLKSQASTNRRKRDSKLRKDAAARREEYYNAPRGCKQCDNPLQYENRCNTFCSKSCAASYNNARRSLETIAKQKETFRRNHPVKVKIPQRGPKHLRPPSTRIAWCIECGKPFELMRKRKTCSSECVSRVLSTAAKNNPKMGGNRNNRACGYYTSPSAGRVWLESSYEYTTARSLDAAGVIWERPRFFEYVDEDGERRRYYPDFYLPDYDVYLDPKNAYLIEQDAHKINDAAARNGVTILVLTKNQLEWDVIKTLI